MVVAFKVNLVLLEVYVVELKAFYLTQLKTKNKLVQLKSLH